MTSIQKIPAIISRAVRTGTNLHLTGNPGIGKTMIIEQAVRDIQKGDADFKLWNIYTPSMSPLDFMAVVPDFENGTLKNFHNTLLPNRYDDPNIRGILFLGERDNADPATNKALQKYINNEDMGGLMKPKGVIIISDSNSLKHKSGVVQQSLALLSRSRHVEVEVCVDGFLSHLADIGASQYVQAYLSIAKHHVDNFAKHLETRTYGVWANPRAWVRLSDGLLDMEATEEAMTDAEIIGDIGEPVGKEFIGFLRAARTLVNYEDIITDPETAFIPEQMSDVYAVIAMLATSTKAKDLKQVRAYVERYGVEVQVLYHKLLASGGSERDAIARTPEYRAWFRENPELTAAILDLT
jgi:hypothetical protein